MALPPFQQLLDAHGRDVHRFLLASVGGSDADDVYQETWLAALRAYPELRSDSHLRGWVFTIAHHKVIDHVRTRGRRAVPVADPELDPAREPLSAGAGASQGAGAAAIASAEGDGQIWSAVAALPPKQRTAVALRFVADLAYAEIAALMGTSEAAARRNVHEALTRLRREQDDEPTRR
jgi:RNA polymerase sigma factor (sigma-70 family)